MTLTILKDNDEREVIENVYSLGIDFGRVYIHWRTKERGMDTQIHTVNYPLSSIVDILTDFNIVHLGEKI